MTRLHRPLSPTRNTPALNNMLPAGLAVVGLVLGGLLLAPLSPKAHAANDQLAKAIEEQRSLIDYDSQSPELYSDLGNLLALDQQWRAAEEAYRTALILDAEHSPAAFNLALLLQRQGQDDEALALLEGVAVRMPGHAWAHYQRGRILQAKGKRREAVEAYATAFAADPELTFSDVNPHLVGNDLATEALLRIDESKIPIAPDNAPRTYSDADRIVGLLVPEPESEGPEGGEAATQPQPETDEGSSAPEVLSSESLRGGSERVTEPRTEARRADTPTRARPLSVEEAARRNDSRNVNSDDLEDLGSFNQASPQAGDSRPAATSTRPRPAGTRGVPIVPRTGTPQAQPGAQPQPTPDAQQGTPPINRTSPRAPARPGRFLPGTRSSAQLDRQIERIAPSP